MSVSCNCAISKMESCALTFSTIDVPSGTDPVADSESDTLTLLAGAGITITGDAATDTITFANTGAVNAFTTIDCPNGTDPVADSATDTLTLTSTSGTAIITGNSTTDTVNFDIASAEIDDGNSSTADTIDFSTGPHHKSTLTGNCTYTFTAPVSGMRLVLKLVQDGTGSRTATWPAAVKWPNAVAPTLSTAASAVDVVSFYFDGTNYYGMIGFNFA